MQFDIKIRRTAKARDIPDIAAGPGLMDRQILNYGHHLAKITHGKITNLQGRPEGRLILVRAINPPLRTKANPRPPRVWGTH